MIPGTCVLPANTGTSALKRSAQPFVRKNNLPGDTSLLMKIANGNTLCNLSRNFLFEHIKSLQCCELTRRCSPLPAVLASPLTYALNLNIVNVN